MMSSEFAASPASRPLVTVVMTCRERHGLSERAIETVLRNTTMPFRFLYADVGSPERLRTRLEQRAREWGVEIIRFEDGMWPTQVRRRLGPSLDTKYAVFIDNDVLVGPGWLEQLCACAEETGAGIVGPLYLWGADAESDRIHMAGGQLTEEKQPDGLVLRERHLHINRKLGEVVLQRQECGFVEFHCMLMRDEVYSAPGIFDENIVCVHEHIHASLVARELGYKTVSEPAARATYLAAAPYTLSDLAIFRRRWSHEAGESSIRAFARRWGVIDDQRSFGVRNFLTKHRAEVDPVRATIQDPRIAQEKMLASDLKQTLTELVERAAARGYTQNDMERIKAVHWAATILSNGGYRPCGRPFINHLTGTASVLVHFGFETRLILAALLHAAYTHAPRSDAGPASMIEVIARSLGGRGSPLELMVRAYTLRAGRWKELQSLENWREAATMTDVEIAAITLANDVEMHLSGEIRATGRADGTSGSALANAAEICRVIGVPGLPDTLAGQDAAPALPLVADKTRPTASFRIQGTKLVPMVNPGYLRLLQTETEQAVPAHA